MPGEVSQPQKLKAHLRFAYNFPLFPDPYSQPLTPDPSFA
jgi:hypothetical protein